MFKCAKCGTSDPLVILHENAEDLMYSIECQACGRETPTQLYIYRAKRIWQRTNKPRGFWTFFLGRTFFGLLTLIGVGLLIYSMTLPVEKGMAAVFGTAFISSFPAALAFCCHDKLQKMY